MEYQTNSHCKYLIALHLILVVKYRKTTVGTASAEETREHIQEQC